MKRNAVDISSDDSYSAAEDDEGFRRKKSINKGETGKFFRRVEMYQDYMKQLPIPSNRPSVIPCTTWQGLAKSIKHIYGQPLHYLTNICLKTWDQLRIGAEDEHQPLDAIIHPSKAEVTIWRMEEVHRLTTSHQTLSKYWLADPTYNVYVDSNLLKLGSHVRRTTLPG